MARIEQINVSTSGVPKTRVDQARVDAEGLEGDGHEHPGHGPPGRAVMLWSLEVIDALREEGHPIAPGSAGENVTVSGLDWSRVAPGLRLRLGEEVTLEVTTYAAPCPKNARWFTDGEFVRIHHKKHPGSSRVGARVLEDGTIRTGDPVEVLR